VSASGRKQTPLKFEIGQEWTFNHDFKLGMIYAASRVRWPEAQK
jgi:hypothetical protein